MESEELDLAISDGSSCYIQIKSNQTYWTTKSLKASYKLLKHTKKIKATDITCVAYNVHNKRLNTVDIRQNLLYRKKPT